MKIKPLRHSFRAAALCLMATAGMVVGGCKRAEAVSRLEVETGKPFNAYDVSTIEMQDWPYRQQAVLRDSTVSRAYALWMSGLDDVKKASLYDKADAVNDLVNATVTYTRDSTLYRGDDEYWSPAAQTILFRRGDCEDFAIAKYDALRRLGVSNDRLMLLCVTTQDTMKLPNHCVLAVDTTAKNTWTNSLILDDAFYEDSGKPVHGLTKIQDTGYKPYIGLTDKTLFNVKLTTLKTPKR